MVCSISAVDNMNLQQVKKEIEDLGVSPVDEKMYPVTSDWVPISDVLAIINRFEKHWSDHKGANQAEESVIAEILGNR
jgi:hypothetical protein